MSEVNFNDLRNLIYKLKEKPEDLFTELEHQSTDVLCGLLPSVAATGSLGAQYEAVRQGIEAILARRHTADLVKATDRVVATMDKLDRSANRLSLVGILVGAVIGIAEIIVPLFVR
jgi:hypothetical protein